MSIDQKKKNYYIFIRKKLLYINIVFPTNNFEIFFNNLYQIIQLGR